MRVVGKEILLLKRLENHPQKRRLEKIEEQVKRKRNVHGSRTGKKGEKKKRVYVCENSLSLQDKGDIRPSGQKRSTR